MWTIEWKTYEQMTDYEKLKFDLNKKYMVQVLSTPKELKALLIIT